MVRLLLLSLALTGCMGSLDVNRPIDLLLGSGWSEAQLQVLQDAAECWNLELGTQLRLVDPDTATAAQQVPIAVSDFICGFANGLTDYVGDLEVQICSLDASSPHRLKTVVLHELGHVLNIRDHAGDRLAVMNELGKNTEVKHFRPADRQLFHGANPDFEAADECQVAQMIGESPSRPVMVTHPTHGTVMLWAAWNGLEVRRPGTVPWPLIASIPSKGIAGWLRAVPTSKGVTVTWTVGLYVYGAEVDLETEEVRPLGQLEVGKHDFDRDVDAVSMAIRGTEIYLAVTEGDINAETWLYRIDGATGQRLGYVHHRKSWEVVHVIGDALLLTSRDSLGVGVRRLNPDMTTAERLELEPPQPLNKMDAFTAQAVDDTLVVTHRRHDQPMRLHRVTAGDTLVRGTTSDLQLPGKLGYTMSSLAQGPAGLAVAVNRVARENFEVYVSLLDPVSLDTRKPWTRLSAPDFADSLQPWLAPHGAGFMAVWRDVHDLSSIEVRGRCF